jgi:hypothetical protein
MLRPDPTRKRPLLQPVDRVQKDKNVVLTAIKRQDKLNNTIDKTSGLFRGQQDPRPLTEGKTLRRRHRDKRQAIPCVDDTVVGHEDALQHNVGVI